MTQEAIPVPTDDIVTQAQSEIDQQQEATPASQPITEEQVKAMLEAQAAGFQRQVSGLQSGFSKALDGMRDQYEANSTAQDARLQNEFAWNQALSTMDEETQATVRGLRQAEAQRPSATVQTPAQVEQSSDVQAAQDAQTRMANALITGMGLDPNDPNIDRTILNNEGLTAEQRTVQFIASLGNAKVAQAGQRPATTAAPATADTTVNPPVDRGTGGAAGGLRTVDQLQEALATQQLTVDQYRERMAEIGQPVP